MKADEIFSWIATILGFGLKSSPIVLFYKIALGKETIEIVPEMLIICNVLCAELWFSYWTKKGDKLAPLVSSSVSLVLGIIFSFVYLFYFSGKKCLKFLLYILLEAIFVCLLFYGLSLTEVDIVGKIANVVNVITFISPGQRIVRVCKEKNYKLIPIWTTVLGCISSFLWLCFGILIKDINCIIPNAISVTMALFNTLVWLYFYCITKDEEKKDEKDNEVEMIETDKGDKEVNEV